MWHLRAIDSWAACLLAASVALVGCAPKTDVSTTGNVPAQYSHVYMSVQELWFNTDATAAPADTTWIKFPLNTPVTFDLSASLDGKVNSLTTGLALPIGTYEQIRLSPVDSGSPLLSSARSLGAVYNSEVDYVDSNKTSHQVPLELQNPELGIGIHTSIAIKGTATNVFASNGNSNSLTMAADSTTATDSTASPNSPAATDSTTTANSPTATDSTTSPTSPTATNSTTNANSPTATDSTTTATTSSSTSSGSSTPSTPVSLAINFDGSKDLVPFTYAATNAMLLNPHVTAYDTAAIGAIQGTLSIGTLSGISNASTSSYVDIQVTAESVSADGTRHVTVNSAPVRSDGTFTLYPLATSSSSPTSYDLVIHGPAIATVIVKGVAVNPGDPATTTPVNIGTITPRAASSFAVNLSAATPLPPGALVGFYQTLPGSNEVPYLIEERAIDPFSRVFATDQAISAATIDYGTFSSSSVSLTAATAVEGAGTYRVAATAPLYSDGSLSATVTARTTPVAVPALTVASGAVPTTAVFTVDQSTAGKYDQGNLIISHDGAIVATAALDSVLARSGASNLAISGLPGGGAPFGVFSSGLYYVSVRAWNSANPPGTLTRESFPAPLDLRGGVIGPYSLTIN